MPSYTLRKRINPQKPKEPPKYFPTPFYSGVWDLDEISERISHATTLTPADISAVIQALVMQISRCMEYGVIAKLDGFGTFKLAFSGTGKKKPSDVNARNIDGIHILFTPDIKLRKKIKRFRFSRVKSTKKKLP